MNIDKKIIRSLSQLLKEEDLSELDIGQGESYIRITRHPRNSNAKGNLSVDISDASAPLQAVAASNSSDNMQNNPNVLKAPFVGVVYLTPDPGSPPYVKEGQNVSEGQTILIIEAMKTMNYVKAHKTGVLTQILVKQEEPIEYGQPLIVIE